MATLRDQQAAADPETGELPSDDQFESPESLARLEADRARLAEAARASAEYEHLLSQVDRDIVGWKPEPGDKVFGRVADVMEAESDFGQYPLIAIDSPLHEQLVGVHCFHTTLKNDVQRKIDHGTLAIGSEIAVSYRGMGEARGGNSAPHMYRVAVIPPPRPSAES